MNRAQELAASLSACFRKHMLEEYLPRIRKCVELLSVEQAWQKPAKHGNSVANLLLHLIGNTTQWILCGLGDQEDMRDRGGEFAAQRDDAQIPLDDVLDRLEATVSAACEIVANLSVAELLAERDFQGGRYRGSGMSGVLHVLEHFSGHAGQIYALTKQLTETDLGFYVHLSEGGTEATGIRS